MTNAARLAGLHVLDPHGSVEGVVRETPVVCIPVYGAHGLFAECLDSVLRHTPVETPIVVADDASPDPASGELLRRLAADGELRHAVWYLRQPGNLGFVENVNSVFEAAAPADVVLLNSDTIVGPEWLERLQAAAYSDSTVATATALTNHGTILSIPHRNQPQAEVPGGLSVDQAAVAVANASARLRPRIPTAIGHCAYVRRAALDLVGGFDPAFSPGYGEEVDFSQRCVLQGLSHVAADDVFVFHHGGSSFKTSRAQKQHEQVIRTRYPYYHVAVDEIARRRTGPLPRALATAARAVTGLTVTIDGRCLGPTVTGTQVHVLELAHALWRTGKVQRLRVVVPPDVGDFAKNSLLSLDRLELVRSDEIDGTAPTQIVHRPYQVFHVSDLPLLAQLGDRLVITQQDMIAYRNPGYARSGVDWLELHRLTRVTLAAADMVAFFSAHAAADTMADELVPPAHAEVVYLGVDHTVFRPPDDAVRPPSLPAGTTDGFLLCLGTNFMHKNRTFAIDVLEQLQKRRRWQGWLVLAGPHAASGTSTIEERARLAAAPELAERTVDLDEVSDGEKRWLMEHSGGVLYPSVYEGFGLIPFEAAEVGAPCFFAAQTALAETLPPSTATIVRWDAAATAEAIADVLASPERRRALATAVQAAGSRLLWDRTAQEMLRVYERALARPHRDLAVVLDGTTNTWDILSLGAPETLRRLEIPFEPYRALLAIFARPVLRRLFLGLLTLFFRAGYLARHRRLPH